MIHPIDFRKYKVTSDFNDKRVNASGKKYIHGATDFGTPEGTPIYCPESGHVYYHWQNRKRKGTHDLYWPKTKTWYQFSNYFNDEFGCLIFVQGSSGITHVFAHINPSTIVEMLNKFSLNIGLVNDDIGTFINNLDDPVRLGGGEVVGYTGNHPTPGHGVKSTGPHLHIELHKNYQWVPKSRRVDPEDLYGLKD